MPKGPYHIISGCQKACMPMLCKSFWLKLLSPPIMRSSDCMDAIANAGSVSASKMPSLFCGPGTMNSEPVLLGST